MKDAMATMTAAEFLALPELDAFRGAQLIEGEFVLNVSNRFHNECQKRLLIAIHNWGGGSVHLPEDVLLDGANVYAPDVVWHAAGADLLELPPYGVPDLAVEVRSESTWRYDVGAKKEAYERVGLPELWLVDVKAHEVLVFRRSEPGSESFDVELVVGEGYSLTSPQLPGFVCDVGALFAV